MSKKLIITEKPSVARDFARVLGVSGRQDGYIENNEYVISWCVGHLVEMLYPEAYDDKYKKWRVEDLPFLPKVYKYGVIKDVEKQYYIVNNLLHREDIDVVYWAGDSGKEGQTIEENIRNFGGVREGMSELRVWIDSQTDEEIRRGIREAKPMSDYKNLGNSGIMRSIEDYALGINFSRVLSVKYGRLLNDAAATKSYTAIAVGRVMTCVLGMVVIREREIRNYVEIPFYRVIGKFTDQEIEAEWKTTEQSKYFNSPLLYKENGFKEEKNASELIDFLRGKTATVASIEKSPSKKRAPLLFNLAELQAECAKLFKISPDQTLAVAQELYEKKMTTYPRTDARVLTKAVAKEISKNLSKLKSHEPLSGYVTNILNNGLYRGLEKTAYTDDSKVTDHYAIIPTGQTGEYSSLSDLQRNVYDLICRRFLSIFYPPAEFLNLKLVINVDNEKFFMSSKILTKKGYMEISGVQKNSENDKDTDNPDNTKLLELCNTLSVGQEIGALDYCIKEGKTSPPKRYTSGTMILAMENAGNLIEDEELRAQIKNTGIGTSATRAEIIKKLIKIGYLNLNQKTQVLSPENLGEMIYEVVNLSVPSLLNPKMSASWEKGLEGIVNGSVDLNQYRAKLEDYIRTETLRMAGNNLTDEIASNIHQFTGKGSRGIATRKRLGIACPDCGGELVTTPFGYGCSNFKNEEIKCRFNIGTIAGRDLSEEEFSLLLKEKKTPVLTGFKGTNKKAFKAALYLAKNEDNKTEVRFDFSEVQPDIVEGVKCPNCGGDIQIKSFGYGCANYRPEDPDSCKFSIGSIAKKDLSIEQVKELLSTGRTQTIRGFKSKNGSKFDACLVLDRDDKGNASISFDFDNVEVRVIKDVKCPVCQGDIVKTSFGYGCSNYRKDDTESCKFCVSKVASKELNETQLKQLINDGRTSTIYGFKSKTNKKFDARLALAKDENGKITGIKFDFDDIQEKKVKDVKCPACGGDIVISKYGFRCSNHSNTENKCEFKIGKIAGVSLTEKQLKMLLNEGKTDEIDKFVAKTGMMFSARLKLNEEHRVVFDFGQDMEPKETDIICPKCQKNMTQISWYYTCDCGHKIPHTIASLRLPALAVAELIEKGKTSERQTGFISKSGNPFDAYLEFRDGKVQFNFDETGKENSNDTNNN